MRVRWTAEARSDLVWLYEFLAVVNLPVAVRVLQRLWSAPSRLRQFPRLGSRRSEFAPREVRRLIVDDYELRYEIKGGTIIVLNLWHTREDR